MEYNLGTNFRRVHSRFHVEGNVLYSVRHSMNEWDLPTFATFVNLIRLKKSRMLNGI